ncbi:MAG: beta-N-acetylhexosaminidase [Microbacterium sp.]
MNRRQRRLTSAALALTLAAALAACAPGGQNGDTVTLPALVPLPASIAASGDAPFRLSADTTISGDPDAAATLQALLQARTGAGASTGPAGEAGIELAIAKGGAPESYTIAASEASIAVTGADAAGLFYGVQTLGQLIRPDGGDWVIPAVDIADAPRFAYRGVMLDVARHFQTVETITAYIDRAAGLKFNALHLHLSDDQSWRLQLESRPLLTELSSSSSVGGDPGGFYTKADYAEIVDYAAAHHMIVVPEFDMPSHTHAITLAYPELMEEPVIDDHMREIAATHGGDLPVNGVDYDGMAVGFSSLKIRDEATYDFVADVFGELAAMTPGPYLHFGGDESLATSDEDFDDFVSRVSGIIEDLGKTPVAWHEAGSAKDLASDTVGQYWGYVTPTDGMDDKARAFAQVILSPADAIYLDMKPTAESDLGLTWANGPTSVERSYSWEPAAIIDGVDDSSILGVEAPMWSETITNLDDIDAMAFPRIASAAEAAWSPATTESELRTWESFRERVGAMGPLWTSLGIGYLASDEIPWVTEQ